MKYIKSIHEEFDRVVGFRYSEPKEAYKITVLCMGEEITTDKVEKALGKVSNLKFKPETINVTNNEEETLIETPNGVVSIDAFVNFDIVVYTDREIRGIIEELGDILSSAFDIEILNFKVKKDFGI